MHIEYSLNATMFKHKKSGAQIISVSAADENKVSNIHNTGVSYTWKSIHLSILCFIGIWYHLPYPTQGQYGNPSYIRTLRFMRIKTVSSTIETYTNTLNVHKHYHALYAYAYMYYIHIRSFPVKEPFVDLLKGSLQNFLNAMTYPDRTCYPVASTNTKDFYNLAHVYLDAVFNPRAVTDPQVLI